MASEKDNEKSDGNRNSGTSKRGFASMDYEKQREIASKGGKAAHEKGTAHEFTSEEAREAGRAAHERGTAHEFDSEEARAAGRKGGKAAHARGTAHEFDSEEAREAGRKGGEASRGSRSRSGPIRQLSSEQHGRAGRQSHKNA
jgi:general stress protein YciG